MGIRTGLADALFVVVVAGGGGVVGGVVVVVSCKARRGLI
jgi:hypothetical protein